MKRVILFLLAGLGGAGVGGVAAVGVGTMLPPMHQTPASQALDDDDMAFVPTGQILAPLVLGDGGLAGYANFDVQLEVPSERQEEVAARIPLLLNALNLRTYRAPLAAGPGGQIPDLTLFRKLVRAAADETLGRGTVREVAITQARPE